MDERRNRFGERLSDMKVLVKEERESAEEQVGQKRRRSYTLME